MFWSSTDGELSLHKHLARTGTLSTFFPFLHGRVLQALSTVVYWSVIMT